MVARDDERYRNDERLESLILAFDEDLSRGLTDANEDDTLPDVLAAKLRGAQECLRLLEQARQDGFTSETPDTPAAEAIGRFRLLRELGRGGYGIVFLAFDPLVRRRVALKIARPEILIGSGNRRRFLREAEAAGALAHPNLIPVYEVGEDGPVCFIASEYCDGPNLAQWLKSRSQPPSSQVAAQLIAVLADGVEHAHRRGVLHRDIKPSNVLLESMSADAAEPSFTPRLTDFGLAKLAEFAGDETRSTALLGTPTYMAPEQAEGRLVDVGPGTDVYAMGVVLYEMLAGRPPFQADSDVQTLQEVSRGEVPPLARFRRGLPRDLEAIVLKCLERAPARRYRSAADLAIDLRRFISGQPTVARPTSLLGRAAKWARRRPAIASLLAVVAICVSALSVGGCWYAGQLQRALASARVKELDNHRIMHAANLSAAAASLADDKLTPARELLAREVPVTGEVDRRDFAFHYLHKQAHSEQRTFTGHSDEVYSVAYSRDGRLLATASKDRTARVWDFASGRCLHVLTGHTDEVNSVSFSNDGKLLATASDDGTVRIWDVASGQVERVLACHAAGVYNAEFAVTGHWLATCGRDKTVKLWKTQTWELTELKGHASELSCLAFSRDGLFLATGSVDGEVRTWDVTKRSAKSRQKVATCAISDLCFSRDRARLLIACREGRSILEWDQVLNKPARSVASVHPWVHAAVYLQVDQLAAVGTKEGSIKLVDTKSGRILDSLHGHATRVWSLAASPDGRYLAAAGADHTVKVWDVYERAGHDIVSPGHTPYSMAQSPDGTLMVTGALSGEIAVWNVPERRLLWAFGPERKVLGDFDGDGRRDVASVQDGAWILPGEPRSIQFGRASDLPVVGDWDGDGRDNMGFFRRNEGKFYLDRNGGGAAEEVCDFREPDKDYAFLHVVFAGRWDREPRDRPGGMSYSSSPAFWHIKLMRTSDQAWSGVFRTNLDAAAIAGRWETGFPDRFGLFDPKLDAIYSESALHNRWEYDCPPEGSTLKHPLATWNEPEPKFISLATQSSRDADVLDTALDRRFADSRVDVVAMSPDASLLAVVRSDDPRVQIRDLQTGRRLAVLPAPPGYYAGKAVFAPAGQKLAVGYTNGQIGWWDTNSWELVGKQDAHQSSPCLAYTRDGQFLVSTADEGVIKLWDDAGQQLAVLADPTRYRIESIDVSADGETIAVGGTNRLVSLWDVRTRRKTGVLVGHTQTVDSVSFSRDGRNLVSAGPDGSVKLWDLMTHQEVVTFCERQGRIFHAEFSPLGDRIISLNDALARPGEIHIWNSKNPPLPGRDEPRRAGPLTPAGEFTYSHKGDIPALASDGCGNVIVAWAERDTQGSRVRARRFDAAGLPREEAFIVYGHSKQQVEDPAVAMNSSGAFVVVWRVFDPASESDYVQFRAFDADAKPLRDKASAGLASPRGVPAVGLDEAGNVVIVSSVRVASNLDCNIVARRFDAQGQTIGKAFSVHTASVGSQECPDLVMRPDGAFLVLWSNDSTTWGRAGICARRFDAAGEPLDAHEILLHACSPANTQTVSGACDAEGNWVVTWARRSGWSSAFARRFDAQMRPLGTLITVESLRPHGRARLPRVVMGQRGEFAIAWHTYGHDPDGHYDVYIRRFSPTGESLGAEFFPGTPSNHAQDAACVTATSPGEFAVAWRRRFDVRGQSIYLQRFDFTARDSAGELARP